MKRLLILSGKGGTGKTTAAAAFIRFSEAKAAADCDVDAPNLHIVIPQTGTPQISDFLGGDKAYVSEDKCIGCGRCEEKCRFKAISLKGGKAKINEYLCEGCGVCEYVCPAGAIRTETDTAGRLELYKGERVFSTAELKMGRGNSGKLVAEVKQSMYKNAGDCELAIIDGSPGIGCPVIASISGVDMVLAVAEPSESGLSDLFRLAETTQTFGVPLAVCVNKWDVSPKSTEKIEALCKEKGLHFTGRLPYDKTASKAINKGKSVADIDCPLRDALLSVYSDTIKLLNQ